ncbi:MAG TPA: EAL domain-containing protein [Xanthobacteraceae bacterium]|nr:EAL domain-containing protein [Xanthobacteraceae bacterium]
MQENSATDIDRALQAPVQAPSLKAIPLRRLWWAAIVLLGLSVGAVGFTIWQLRDDAINAAVSDTGNIATILAGQFSRSLHTIDAMLLELRSSSKGLNIDTPEKVHAIYGTRQMFDTMRAHLAALPHTFNIVVADGDGRLVVSTAAWPTPDIDVSDRDYFKTAQARDDGRLSTSVPIRNRIDGNQTIVFARRLETPSGAFAGIIFASVNSNYFESIYASAQSIKSLIFNLIREDGTILFRHPDSTGFAGKRLSQEITWQDALNRGTKSYRILAQADNNYRYVSVRTVPEYPLFVNISVSEATALGGWLQRSAMIGVGSAALLLCSIYLLIAITRQVRALSGSEASLLHTTQQLDAALNNMAHGISMFDRQQRLVVVNKQYAAMYNLSPSQVRPGTLARDILEARVAAGVSPASRSYAADRLKEMMLGKDYSTVDYLRDGRVIAINHQRMDNGGWVAVHQDITAQKRVEAELAHMARYDALTGLANRALFLEKVNEALARMASHDEPFSILMLDLDRFKAVNDSLGHAIGDSLLKAVAERLRWLVRDLDVVARLGGDEFAVIQIADTNQRDQAAVLANRILTAITEPYEIDGRKIVIGTSIGIALAPQDADAAEADILVRRADLALYKSKSEGRNRYRFFQGTMEAEARDRRELEEDMRRALLREEFELHYQTVIDVGRRECFGAEALVRWRHPERGLLAPDQFIGLAEDSGLIMPLGGWILRRACSDAAKWPAHLKIAVNLSPVQLKQSNLLDVIKSALKESNLDPGRLELEITETVLVEKSEENLALLHEIKNLGISIVLDDFGTGYSSMRYLQMFPFDRIKIDKSFIQSMTTHSDSAAIVCAITGLGRGLDIETTAEGVETTEQLAFLRTAGCQLGQGYLFSRPVPLAQLSFEQPEALRSVKAA